MTGFRGRFFVPVFVVLGLSAILVVAATTAGLPPPARLLLVLAAFLVAAAFCMALLFLRRFSLSVRRILENVSGGDGLSRESPFLPEAALQALDGALRDMAAGLGRRAEEAEAEGRQYLAILNGMSEAVLAMDRDLILNLANRRACSLFALDEWRGFSLLKATRSTVLEKVATKVLDDGRPRETEFKLRKAYERPRRSEQVFRVSAVPLSAPGGVEGVLIVMEDITRLSRLEQVRKDFVANVSHELRTPIQLVKGFSETLLDDPAFYDSPPDRLRRFIEIIRRNAETMENLTNDLLDIASLENKDRSLGERTRQPLAPLFDEAVLSVGPQAEQKGIRLSVDCPGDLEAAVHGSLVIQALINLLNNAIKYSPKRSRVRALAFRKGGKAVLEVRDEGMGIPSEHLGRIFERFYRVDRAQAGGTGLGLSIVRHIARLHKGRAEVESHAGEGSVFRIVFPG
ncbi:MAG: ATP-binding protein [Treponema sp.]|nr:ATP-binding protein [Treponema sp.]